MSVSVVGARLKAAREGRNLNQENVALILGVNSHQIVSQIEQGDRRISPDELTRLIEGLGVDLDYFTDPYRLVGDGKFCWRQSGRTVEELKAFQDEAGRWIALFRFEAPRVGRRNSLLRPKLPLAATSSYEDAMSQGERVASELKLLDDGPCPAARLAEAMEREWGILVLMVDAIDGVSGAACHLPDLDAVLVNRREVAGRRHFDLAHELFHIMTWEAMPPDYSEAGQDSKGKRSRVEHLADNFASAVLMPSAVLSKFGQWRELGTSELVGRLNEVADELQVTAQALKWRLVALGKLSKAAANSVHDEFLRHNGRGQASAEPPSPFSRLFMEVLGAALDRGNLSKRRAAKQLGVDVRGLRTLFDSHEVPVPEGV